MSKSKRRCSNVWLDVNNIIQAEPGEEQPVLRRSLRLRRSSMQFCIPTVAEANPDTPSESTGDDRLCPTEPATIEPVDCTITANSPSLHISEASAQRISPPSSPPAWLRQAYEPPKPRELQTLPEHRLLKECKKPLRECDNLKLIRRQIFTGQTLEEACLPQGPGMPELDPKMVLAVTRMRVRSRHQRARKLGFRGIQISYRTERRLTQLMQRDSTTPLSSPEM